MEHSTAMKSNRVLQIYVRLTHGETLKKKELAREFGVAERSIQRDMEALRCFLAEQHAPQEIVYDQQARGYFLQDGTSASLSNQEILAVCKILLESRSLRGDEMLPILDKLIDCCVPKQNRKMVSDMIANEKHHYIEPHHRKPVLHTLWQCAQAVQGRRVMEVQYERLKAPKEVTRKIKPVGLMFSEYYFYLIAFIIREDEPEKSPEATNDLSPTIYRLDRIRDLSILQEHFDVPYAKRFQEGEFRKRVQFMYGGALRKVKFLYRGASLEAVLDRLPTAKVVREEPDGSWLLKAEAFGDGILMWLRSQGEWVEILEGGEANPQKSSQTPRENLRTNPCE